MAKKPREKGRTSKGRTSKGRISKGGISKDGNKDKFHHKNRNISKGNSIKNKYNLKTNIIQKQK